MDIRKLQRAIVDGLEDVKAQNIVVFNTEALSPLFERVIIASGTSNRQTKALASSVRETVKKRGLPVLRTEGEDNGEWIIVDCGAAVAHIMQPAIRDYYHLEEIWGAKPVHLKGDGRAAGPGRLPKASEPLPERTPAKTAAKAAARTPAKAPAKTAAKKRAAPSKTAAKKAAVNKAPAKKSAAPRTAQRAAASLPARPVSATRAAPRAAAPGKTAGAARKAAPCRAGAVPAATKKVDEEGSAGPPMSWRCWRWANASRPGPMPPSPSSRGASRRR
ncbi:MAG: ribosome silencing factor [Rubrivivax sp.]